MGARSFNLWPRCEEIINSLPDGRKHWRQKHLPLIPSEEEYQIGTDLVGRPAMSKSLFVNEAIIHYHDKECGQMRNNIQALQKRLFEAHQEIDQLKEEKRKWWWQRG